MASVLVIEDEPNIAMVLEMAFSDEGHHVTVARDGLTGLSKLLGGPKPDIIFLDLGLPGIKGQDLLEQIHNNPRLNKVLIVVMTGYEIDCLDLPKDRYTTLFHKPFDLDKMINALNNLTAAPKH
jgi:two-component system copper resistance phosphate regulon response regulator CusR